LRSWSLVKMATTANHKKLFFNLRKAQRKISILDDGDMRLDQVKFIARRLGVSETDVIYMNRRLGGDASLNAPIREDGASGEWQDWRVDESPDQETTLAASEELDNRRNALSDALTVLNERERRIFETRRLAHEQITLAELAEEFGVTPRARAPDRGKSLREGAELSKAPRRHDGDPSASAGRLASNLLFAKKRKARWLDIRLSNRDGQLGLNSSQRAGFWDTADWQWNGVRLPNPPPIDAVMCLDQAAYDEMIENYELYAFRILTPPDSDINRHGDQKA
jgi:DNA-directed RNA polymerase specialized sigma24 family protein